MRTQFIKLSGVGIDCPNAAQLATFYAKITGGTVTSRGEQWACMSGPGGTIAFWTVPDHQPPTWPGGTTPKQIHLDFYVDDLAATEKKILAAGATKYDFQPNSDHCYVYADPDLRKLAVAMAPDLRVCAITGCARLVKS